jgi:hypothetical protein
LHMPVTQENVKLPKYEPPYDFLSDGACNYI